MTGWDVRRETVTKNLELWRVFRIVDGVEELDVPHYATLDEAVARVWELNAKMKKEAK